MPVWKSHGHGASYFIGGHFNFGELGFGGPWVSAVSALVFFNHSLIREDFFYFDADVNFLFVLTVLPNICARTEVAMDSCILYSHYFF